MPQSRTSRSLLRFVVVCRLAGSRLRRIRGSTMTRTAFRLASLTLLVLLSSAAAPPAPRLRIDPRMLLELQTVREVIATPSNVVWPGWNASDTPALIYLPGVQDV